jgi:hypothetical protein
MLLSILLVRPQLSRFVRQFVQCGALFVAQSDLLSLSCSIFETITIVQGQFDCLCLTGMNCPWIPKLIVPYENDNRWKSGATPANCTRLLLRMRPCLRDAQPIRSSLSRVEASLYPNLKLLG